jgi:hypothetical protein
VQVLRNPGLLFVAAFGQSLLNNGCGSGGGSGSTTLEIASVRLCVMDGKTRNGGGGGRTERAKC